MLVLDPDRAELALLRRRIARLRRRRQTLLIGIDGRGGAGKSTLAAALAAALPEASVVQIDDFYLPSVERQRRRARGDDEIGGDFDWRRLRDDVLRPLAADRPASYRRYDWPSDRLAETHTVEPGGIVIVEGNYTTRPELRELYDLSVWVEAPHELRLQRGIERDGEHTREQWLGYWMPEEERYIDAVHPERYADLVVDGSVPDPTTPPDRTERAP